jgi:hypothetical protein
MRKSINILWIVLQDYMKGLVISLSKLSWDLFL